MTTTPKQDPATRTPWQRLTAAGKQAQVRHALEVQSLSYGEAAQSLGTSRVAIAGVVERSQRSPSPIQSNSPGKRQRLFPKGRAPRPRAIGGKTKAAPKPKKQPHAGFHKFVALPNLPPPVEPVPREDAWLALPGSSPVAIEHHTTGCRWPVGDAQPFRYCNEAIKPDSVYCPSHSALAFREPPTARPRKDTTQ